MKQQDINILVNRFYDGLTTPEEEATLRDCLENNVDDKYSEVLSQLLLVDKIYEDEVLLDESFDEKILQKISGSHSSNSRRFNIQRVFSGVAATVLLLISIWFITSILGPKEVYGTINNPETAFVETKKILQKVSGNVKKGVKPATTTLKKAETNLDKTKKVKQIKKLNRTGELLKSMTKVTVDYGKS